MVAFTPAQSAGQRALFDRYEGHAAQLFVESAKRRCDVTLSFKLPDTPDARAAFEELEIYLGSTVRRLVPPWAGESQWPPGQRKEQTELRRLVLKLAQGPDPADRAPRELFRRIDDAERRDDTAEAERLRAELAERTAAAEKAYHEKLAAQFGHAGLIATWADIHRGKDFETQRKRIDAEIAPMLGQWPANWGDDELAVRGYASNYASNPAARRAAGPGTTVHCQFVHTDTGVVALARWLFAHGASEMRYTISDYPARELDDPLEE